jgi:hypothetical protein
VLADAEQASIRNHLATCARCRRYYEEIAALNVSLRAWNDNLRPIEATQAFHNRWTRALESQGDPSISAATTLRMGWSALFAGQRTTWAGLGGLWILGLFFRLTAPDSSVLESHSAPPSPRQVRMALQVQRQFLAEWKQAQDRIDKAVPVDRRPKSAPASPRSDRRSDVLEDAQAMCDGTSSAVALVPRLQRTPDDEQQG